MSYGKSVMFLSTVDNDEVIKFTASSTNTLTVTTSGSNPVVNGIHTLNIADNGTIAIGTGGSLTIGGSALATEDYVSNTVQGRLWLAPVRAATTAHVELTSDISNGDTIDGVLLATNDRVLVKHQTDSIQNGIYVVTTGAAERTDDMAASSSAVYSAVLVSEGTSNGDKAFLCTNNAGEGTVGSDNLLFTQFGGGTDVANGSITTAKIATGAVTHAKMASHSIDTHNIRSAAVTSNELAAGAVTTEKIAAGAVTSVELADDAVITDRIASQAVTTDKIQEGAVQTDRIGDGAVTTGKLADGAVITAKIAAEAVTEEKIGFHAVTHEKIGPGSISTGKIESLAVTTGKIDDLAVTTEKIHASAVTTEKIADNAVTENKILDGSVTNLKISAGVVDNTHLATDSVSTTQLLNLAVTTEKIADGAVTIEKIHTDSIDSSKILEGAVNSDKLATDAVITAKIANGAVNSDKLATDAVITANIENGAVNSDKLATDAVITPKIANGAVTTDKIDVDAVTTAKILDANVTAPKLADIAGAGLVLTSTKIDARFQTLDPVICATTAPVTLSTALVAGQTIDGITLTDGDRVLVRLQSTPGPAANGIYIVRASSGTPVRAPDMASGRSDQIKLNATVFVATGSTLGQTTWRLSSSNATYPTAPTVDTNTLLFSQVQLSNSSISSTAAIVASKIAPGTFGAGTYSFASSTISDLGTVTTGNITVGNGKALTVSGTGTFTTGNLTASADLNIGAHALRAQVFLPTSDQNAKTNIRTIDSDDALECVRKMRAVKFDWKSNGEASAGVVAQEMEELTPELVARNAKNELSFNYDGLNAYMIPAIQVLAKKCEDLAEKCEELEEEVAQLKRKRSRAMMSDNSGGTDDLEDQPSTSQMRLD